MLKNDIIAAFAKKRVIIPLAIALVAAVGLELVQLQTKFNTKQQNWKSVQLHRLLKLPER